MKKVLLFLLKGISFILLAIVSLILFSIITPLAYFWIKIEEKQKEDFTLPILVIAVREQLLRIRMFIDI